MSCELASSKINRRCGCQSFSDDADQCCYELRVWAAGLSVAVLQLMERRMSLCSNIASPTFKRKSLNVKEEKP
jgi:hypothetical protein